LSRFVVAAVGEVPDPYRVVARAGDDPGAGWRGGDREDVTGVAREGAPGEVEVVRWRRRWWRRMWRWWRWRWWRRRRSGAALTSAPASPSPTRSACSRRRRRRRTASLA
jgi:hypothetical protein